MLVCNKCGSTQVQVLAWVDANTNEYMGEFDSDAAWCDNCEENCSLREETPEEKQERIEAINYLNQVNSKLKF